jgi:tetratricopeptide (TPR) repeat protein
MIDLFESIIKSHTIVILGEYVKHNNLSDAAKGMLAQGLRTPSLGTWQLFSRELFKELQADNYSWTFAEFPAEFITLDKGLNIDKTNVIAFRNGYAHGATPTDSQCEADIQKFEPFLNILLKSNWITTTRIETRESKAWVVDDCEKLCLHPILVHKSDGGDAPYAFFNDLKNDKVGLLNYPLSKHYREKDFINEFYEYLPIHEWKKSGNNEFFQRIEELTETFKGRTLEREKLLKFVSENNKGYCSIQGNPGIGKSALIAQFFKDLRAQKEITNVHVVEYFIRRGTIQSQIEHIFNYLIRRTDELFIQGKEIRAEGKEVMDLQQQLFAKWRLWGEQCAGKKLLFLIDGLDEGTENNIVKYLPRENFLGVLIIYGSRPGGHKSIDDLWSELPTENHTKLELTGLSREDIRALIYEVANKYELDRDSVWIDAVQKRSQGNPLYLKLLCDAIENGSIALNDIQALPEKIDEYYKAILARYAADTIDGDALLAGLFTFAAARDYLTLAHIKFINKLGDATVLRIGSTLKEVLYENPLTETVLDYQLFHESFREYLVKEKAREVSDAAERIIDFCSTWQSHEGNWELRYCLQHYAAHATISSRKARSSELLMLLANTEYIETQKKVLQHYDATKELFQICLLKASELKLYDRQLEAALCLIDLKYEEANDASKVIALVASGNPDDLELALKRIESFGGADIEGVRRRFILYMLCLMELTLLGSKDAPFRKDTIAKLLKHLNEQIPVDNSIINWNEFFPSYTMFLMACEWEELGLDYLIIYKRTDDLDNEWLKHLGLYTDLQFDVWFKCAHGKNIALTDISIELAKLGKIEQSIECALEISRDIDKIPALNKISSELAKQGKLKEAATIMEQAIECASGNYFDSRKSNALCDISSELAKQGKHEEAALIMEQALECANGIDSDSDKSGVKNLKTMKVKALKNISSELAKQGKHEEAASIMEQALQCASGIYSDSVKSGALKNISSELAKQGKLKEAATIMEQAIECARVIDSDSNRSNALCGISSELNKQGNFELAASLMEQAIECTLSLSEGILKILALKDIIGELAKHGKIQTALECARYISSDRHKRLALKIISSELAKQGKIEETAYVIIQTLDCVKGISSVKDKLDASGYTVIYKGVYDALTKISIELTKQGKLEQAIECTRNISSDKYKGDALKNISIELAKQGKSEQAIDCANGIIYSFEDKSIALINISSELAKIGKIEEATLVIQQAIECARGIRSDYNSVLKDISSELAKQGKSEQAIDCANGIKYSFEDKSIAINNISSELAKQGKLEHALECARGIDSDSYKSSALKNISSELAKQGKLKEAATIMEQAIECARVIDSDSNKSSALIEIFTELNKQDNFELAALLIEQSYECALEIISNNEKDSALKKISSELFKQGNWKYAEKIGLEITQLAYRQSCWKTIAELNYEEVGWQKSLQQVTCFKTDEARIFYLKGWVEKINLCEVNFDCLQEALSIIVHDAESIETLLQKHALHEVLLSNAKGEKINQLNHSLNIQWMLDIANQFPNSNSKTRLSTNIEIWLQEIEDEDDRERVELWAMKVSKGTMNEEDFKLKLEKISFI